MDIVVWDEIDIELTVVLGLPDETVNDRSIRGVTDDYAVIRVDKVDDNLGPATFASNVISTNLQNSQCDISSETG